ncbi:hypothetical protein AB0K14_24955 [Actinosynnema sp. NPDC050801]|jgi:hypothetical protein|uniref:hypothetical protein n=1 Tax=unclassified Actinosynnema TaxID=2637065 RepID=UPI00340C4142
MLKKAGAVAIAAAGLMLLGSPAFATPHHHGDGFGDDYTAVGEFENHYLAEAPDGDYADQFGLINFANDSDLLSNINVCEVEVNVLAIPILSNNDENYCINTDDDGNSDTGQSIDD